MEERHGFVCVNSLSVEHIGVREYISRRSGLRVFLVLYESPIVSSYYILPTRGETHEGLPHTLEHLIFLGSANYPCRGTLDILASRALSIGTNAWTAVDHTAYTISTAGLEGTLKILPVYLDHILRPSLTELSFMTDVHRVTPDGTNSGTVYCEMKTHENTADNLIHFEMVDKLYPGASGYKMNTGGRLDALRETNIQRVRDYHRKFYRLENLSIAICGPVEDFDLILSTIADAESELIANGLEANPVDVGRFFGAKQWEDPVNCLKLTDSSSTKVIFPSDDEETGIFTMSWRGPAWDDYELTSSLSFIGSYLTDTPVSPLQKELVHTDDPYGSSVGFTLEDHKESYFSITVQDVPSGPKGKMDTIESRLKELLSKVSREPINMDRLRTIIQREKLSYLLALENSPHETVIDSVITYAVYSSDRSDLEKLLKEYVMAEKLMLKDEGYWRKVMSDFLLQAPAVSVCAVPSLERSKEIEAFEKQLVEQQLHDNDLQELREREKLVDAIISNKNGGVPSHVIEAFEAASVSKLKLTEWPYIRNFRSLPGDMDGGNLVCGRTTIFNEEGGSIPVQNWADLSRSLDKIQYPMQVNHIASDFVRLSLMVPTGTMELTHQEKKSLALLCALLMVSDVKTQDGTELTGDEFIRLLQQSTTSYGVNLGLESTVAIPDSYAELVNISSTSHVTSYPSMFKLLLHIIRREVRFNKKILTTNAKAMLKTLGKKKRSAKALVLQTSSALRLKGDCVRMSCGLAQQLGFLKKALEGDVIQALQQLYEKLFKQGNFLVHVSCDVNKMPPHWLDEWAALSGTNAITTTLTEHIGFKFGVDTTFSVVTGLYASLASTDVSYLRFVIAAPLGFRHDEYTALCVLCEYLSMMEGPMFRAIRGGGFAYNYSVSYYPSRGELHLSIQQANDLLGALHATQELFHKMINGDVITKEDVFAAKCSLVFNILDEEETLADYSQDTFTSALRCVSSSFSKECLAEIQAITVEHVHRVATKYLGQFMEFGGPAKTMSIVTSRSQANGIYKGLEALNYRGIQQTSVKGLLGFATTGNVTSTDNGEE